MISQVCVIYPLFSPTVLIFCIFHHAHILDRNNVYSLLSKIAMILGCVVSMGAFVAGNCNVSTDEHPSLISLLAHVKLINDSVSSM